MTDNELYNEKNLLADIENGNEAAFRTILNLYWDKMYGNILYHCKQPDLAAELTQDLFMAIWQNRTKLHEIENFEAYLYAIARNLVLAALRKKLLPVVDTDPFDSYFTDDGFTGVDLLELKELQSVISKAINELPPQMKEAFILSRVQGLSHDQVAGKMKISRFSSQTYVARATVRLRSVLARYEAGMGFLLLISYLL